MGAGDAQRAFVLSLLNLGSITHSLWLQGWGSGCILAFLAMGLYFVWLVFFPVLSLQAKREPDGEGLSPVLF